MFKNDLLKNKTALITGGGTGLGKALAANFVSYGAKVAIVSRKQEHLQKAAQELDTELLTLTCDVRNPDQVENVIGKTIEKWGRIDILVNNAAGNFIAPTEELTPNGWKTVIDIVLNGTYYCSHFAGKTMLTKKQGKILNIVATYAWTGNAGTIHSAAAKAGVVALTRTLAVEWGHHGICVNAIAPGLVDTKGSRKNLWAIPEIYERLKKQIPIKRFAEEEEIANAATFLVSDYSDYINGEVLVVDAGLWLNRSLFDIENISSISKFIREKSKNK